MRLLPCTVRPRLGIFSDGTGRRGIAWPGTLAQTEWRQDGAHYNRLPGMANKYFGDRHRALGGKRPGTRPRQFAHGTAACSPASSQRVLRVSLLLSLAPSASRREGGGPARSSKHSNPCLLLFYCARLCRLSRPLGDGPRQSLHIHSRLSVTRRRRPATGRKNRPMLSIGWVVLDLCNAAAPPGPGRRARNPDGGRPRQSLAARRTTGLRNAAEPLID